MLEKGFNSSEAVIDPNEPLKKKTASKLNK